MPSWWGWQTADVRDRATAHLPALLYERLDEIGIDFTILYPSMSLGYFEVTDEELSSVLCRAVNRYNANLFAPYRDRCTVGAMVPMNTPDAGDRGGGVRGARAGREVDPHPGAHPQRPVGRRRLPPRHVRARQRARLRPVLGEVRRTGRGAGRAQLAAAAPGDPVDLELRVQPHRRAGRRARVDGQVAVPRRGHPPLSRAAHRLPRRRGGVGVRAVRRAGRPLGEAQSRRDRQPRPRPPRRRRVDDLLQPLRRRRGHAATR